MTAVSCCKEYSEEYKCGPLKRVGPGRRVREKIMDTICLLKAYMTAAERYTYTATTTERHSEKVVTASMHQRGMQSASRLL